MTLKQFRKQNGMNMLCVHLFTKQVGPGYFRCVNCGLVQSTEEINRRYDNN